MCASMRKLPPARTPQLVIPAEYEYKTSFVELNGSYTIDELELILKSLKKINEINKKILQENLYGTFGLAYPKQEGTTVCRYCYAPIEKCTCGV